MLSREAYPSGAENAQAVGVAVAVEAPGMEAPERYQRKTDEVRGRYIVDGEEPF